MYLHPSATPKMYHTPATVPLHWQEKAQADQERDVALGVIERVPYGEPYVVSHDGCHTQARIVIPTRKVARNTRKTVSDAWNSYHSAPLKESKAI